MLMLALSPMLARIFYLCKCPPFLCSTLFLFFLFLRVSFGLSLISFWGCLGPISHAFNCFIRSLEPLRTRLGKVSAYPFTKLFKIQWTNKHGSFSSCCDVGVCVILKEVIQVNKRFMCFKRFIVCNSNFLFGRNPPMLHLLLVPIIHWTIFQPLVFVDV